MPITNKPNVNIAWAESGAKIYPGDAKYAQGWIAEVPTHQNFNYIQNQFGTFQKHINESGIAAWDGLTNYSKGSLVSYQISSDDTRVYQSLTDLNTNNNPSASSESWIDITDQFLSAGYLETSNINVLSATLNYPKLTSYKVGQSFNLKIANTNTSSNVSLNINNIGSKDIRNVDNTQLAIGDLQAGMIATIIYVIAPDLVPKFYLINPFLSSGRNRSGLPVKQVRVIRSTLATSSNTEISPLQTPLSSQGDLLMQVSITPEAVGNLLVINVSLPIIDVYPINDPDFNASFCATLNLAGETNSLMAWVVHSVRGAALKSLNGKYFHFATNTNAHVFNVKFSKGSEFGGSYIAAVNGIDQNGFIPAFNGVGLHASLSIDEIKQ